MFKTLRSRVTALMVIVVGAALAVVTTTVVYVAVENEIEKAMERQRVSIATAAAVLDLAVDGVDVVFAADGAPERITWAAEPDLSSHAVIDRIGGATGETATVFAYEPENNDFWRRSTNIKKDNGVRAVGTKLGVDGPVHPVLMSGGVYEGEATILGHDYYTIYFPIHDAAGAVAGILYVGVSKAAVNETAWAMGAKFGGLSLAALLIAGFIASLLAKGALAGMARMRLAMADIAENAEAAAVPDIERQDEIGEIARAVESFRQSMVEAGALRAERAAETARAAESRAAMLKTLESRVGGVVAAATEGDFSGRVDANFEEPELNSLASGVNAICERIDAFLSDVDSAVGAMAQGDLTQRVDGAYGGQLCAVAANVNGAVERLAGLVGDIQGAARALDGATREIAEGAGALSDRTENQAAALQETSATMDEMAATVRSNAARARQSAGLADGARDSAGRGQAVLNDTVAAMREIERSSAKINEIVGVIDSISFQTNLLALNAAVEAARAGEAGKGFAVVASEVRTLAQRSSEAARDIKALIADSTGHVGEGVRLVRATGDALGGMASGIEEVAGAVNEIAAGSAQQTTGVEEISGAIRHMDEMTQKNAGLADKSASAARRLTQEGERLGQLIGAFRLGAGHGGEAAADAAWSAAERRTPAAPAPAPKPARAAAGGAPAGREDWTDF